jgi:hypothetical protein
MAGKKRMATSLGRQNARCDGRLAEKLMAEKCPLEGEAISHLSAINLSAL